MVVMEGGERAWYGGNTGLSSSSPHTGTSGSGSWYGGNTGLSPFSPHTGISGSGSWYGGNTGLSSSSPHTGTSGSGSATKIFRIRVLTTVDSKTEKHKLI